MHVSMIYSSPFDACHRRHVKVNEPKKVIHTSLILRILIPSSTVTRFHTGS